MPRPRTHADNAAKQRAYRERMKAIQSSAPMSPEIAGRGEVTSPVLERNALQAIARLDRQAAGAAAALPQSWGPEGEPFRNTPPSDHEPAPDSLPPLAGAGGPASHPLTPSPSQAACPLCGSPAYHSGELHQPDPHGPRLPEPVELFRCSSCRQVFRADGVPYDEQEQIKRWRDWEKATGSRVPPLAGAGGQAPDLTLFAPEELEQPQRLAAFETAVNSAQVVQLPVQPGQRFRPPR